jgi:uncharacterized protein DUF4190
MLCPLCGTPFVPDRLFCMNCGEVSPEGARVMRLKAPEPVASPALPFAPTPGREPVPTSVVSVRSTAVPITVRPRQTSVTAVLSLVLGCLAWLGMPILGALGAVVSGHYARQEIRRSAGRVGGGGLATAGLVLGYAQVALIAGTALVIAIALTAAIAFGS